MLFLWRWVRDDWYLCRSDITLTVAILIDCDEMYNPSYSSAHSPQWHHPIKLWESKHHLHTYHQNQHHQNHPILGEKENIQKKEQIIWLFWLILSNFDNSETEVPDRNLDNVVVEISWVICRWLWWFCHRDDTSTNNTKNEIFKKLQIKTEKKNGLNFRDFCPTLMTLNWFLFFTSTHSFFISRFLVDEFRSRQRYSYEENELIIMI